MNRLYISVLVLIIMSSCLHADWIEEQTLLSGDGLEEDYFGFSVSISGNYAIVGTPNADDNGITSGSAYIYYYNGLNWTEQQKLIPFDNSYGDKFGHSVSISGNYAIIGAYRNSDNGIASGSAYIYYFDGSDWIEQQKLTASDAAATDYFGCSVSICGDFALIGAHGECSQQGAAYIFHYNGSNWIEQQKLTASDGSWFYQFGCAVSISDDYAIIGSYLDIVNYNLSGSAYIFHKSGTSWVERQKLTASDGSDDDHFGYAVSIDGTNALIGARFGDDFTGSAYMFHYNDSSWIEQQRLTAPNGVTSDCFGWSVSIDGNYALIGEPGDDDFGMASGSAHIYHYNGSSWIEQQKLTASDGYENDHLGQSLSISGNYALIGVPYDDDNGFNSGSVRIFHTEGVSTEEDNIQYPIQLRNYPNPFNPTTLFHFSIKSDAFVDLSIYNTKGQKIKTIVNDSYSKGEHSVTWEAKDFNNQTVSSGIYYYKLNVNGKTEAVKKCLLLK